MKTTILLLCMMALGIGSYAQDTTAIKKLKDILLYPTEKAPLYVLDGKTVQVKDSVNFHNLDIASLRILNRQDAISIFGKAGKNGVVSINTKKFVRDNDVISISDKLFKLDKETSTTIGGVQTVQSKEYKPTKAVSLSELVGEKQSQALGADSSKKVQRVILNYDKPKK